MLKPVHYHLLNLLEPNWWIDKTFEETYIRGLNQLLSVSSSFQWNICYGFWNDVKALRKISMSLQ